MSLQLKARPTSGTSLLSCHWTLVGGTCARETGCRDQIEVRFSPERPLYCVLLNASLLASSLRPRPSPAHQTQEPPSQLPPPPIPFLLDTAPPPARPPATTRAAASESASAHNLAPPRTVPTIPHPPDSERTEYTALDTHYAHSRLKRVANARAIVGANVLRQGARHRVDAGLWLIPTSGMSISLILSAA